MEPTDFGKRLRRLRMERGVTPSVLAYAVGVTEAAIRQIEAGQTKWPRFDFGVLLAEALEVTPHYLAFGDTPPIKRVVPELNQGRGRRAR